MIAGVEALLIRLQLAGPNGTLLTASQYNTMFTMHGTTMVFLVGMPMAVVTNKPRLFTERLLAQLRIAGFFRAVVAGDDGLPKKPHGDMLVRACEQMGTTPASTLMLGDSDNDIQAARAAGCPVWCVPYGYNEGRAPESLKCDRLVPDLEAAARAIAA